VAYTRCSQLEKYFLKNHRTNSWDKVNKDIRHCSCYAKPHYRIHTNQPLDSTESHLYTLLTVRQFLKSFFYGRQICSLSLQLCVQFSSSHSRHTFGPSHPPRFHNLAGIRSRVQITNFFINRFAKCLPKDRQPTLFLGSDRRMNKRRWPIVQLLHFIIITFLFVLCFVVKRHANFGRCWQTFLAPFTQRVPFDT
jgi:hypothetical protein